jgi:hypothetical protein
MEGEKFDVTPLTKVHYFRVGAIDSIERASFLTISAIGQVKRLPKRAVYDKEQVYAILDEAFVCHVGFSVDGRPFVLPTGFGRRGEWLYLHGKVKHFR